MDELQRKYCFTIAYTFSKRQRREWTLSCFASFARLAGTDNDLHSPSLFYLFCDEKRRRCVYLRCGGGWGAGAVRKTGVRALERAACAARASSMYSSASAVFPVATYGGNYGMRSKDAWHAFAKGA